MHANVEAINAPFLLVMYNIPDNLCSHLEPKHSGERMKAITSLSKTSNNRSAIQFIFGHEIPCKFFLANSFCKD